MKIIIQFYVTSIFCLLLTLAVPAGAISLQNSQPQMQRRSRPSPGKQLDQTVINSQNDKVAVSTGTRVAEKKKLYYLPGTRISVPPDSPGLPQQKPPRTRARGMMTPAAQRPQAAAPGRPAGPTAREPVPVAKGSRRAPVGGRTGPMVLPFPSGKAPAPVTIPLAAPPITVPARSGGSEAKQSIPPVMGPSPAVPAKEKQPEAAAMKGSASEEGKMADPKTKDPAVSKESSPAAVNQMPEIPPGKAIPGQKIPETPEVRRNAPPVAGQSPADSVKENKPDASPAKDSDPKAGKEIYEAEAPVAKKETVSETDPEKIIVEIIEPGDSENLPAKSGDK